MPKSTLTSKSRVTIAKSIRDRFGLKTRDRLIFRLDSRGGIRVQGESPPKPEQLR